MAVRASYYCVSEDLHNSDAIHVNGGSSLLPTMSLLPIRPQPASQEDVTGASMVG